MANSQAVGFPFKRSINFAGAYNPRSGDNALPILETQLFGAAPSTAGYVKYWNGSVWTLKPVKYWTGSAWVQKPVKFWNGTAWVLA